MTIMAKQCDSKMKHGEHEWEEGVFKRWCKGRKKEAR
jgi:hypothetical protein